MKSKQKIKTPQKRQRYHAQKQQTYRSTKSRSFRSKMFQKRSIQPIPLINDKQIFLHSPQYEKYLQGQFDLSDKGKVPEIWGCIISPSRKVKSERQNYLKRDIDTPSNIFRSYIKRKNKLIFSIPITKEFMSQQNYRSQQHKQKQQNSLEQNNYQNPEKNNQQQNISPFFTEIDKMNATTRQKVKRYDEEQHQQINSSKLLLLRPKNQKYVSRFAQKLIKNKAFQVNKQKSNFSHKSMYKMSLEQLKQSIQWKKHLLQCLNQTIIQTKQKRL